MFFLFISIFDSVYSDDRGSVSSFFSSPIFCFISLFVNICLFHVHILFGNCVSSSELLVNFFLPVKMYFHQFVSFSLLSSFFSFFSNPSSFLAHNMYLLYLFLFSNSSMFLVAFSFNSSHYAKCHSSSCFFRRLFFLQFFSSEKCLLLKLSFVHYTLFICFNWVFLSVSFL
jgi:hypothetical protein